MKYKLLFLTTIYSFLTVQICNGMEKKQDNTLQFIRDLTAIKKQTNNPESECFHNLHYLDNNTVTVSHTHGITLLNSKEDKIINKISNGGWNALAINHNQHKIIFTDGSTINSYNLKTNTLEWSKNKKTNIHSIFYNSYDNTIFLHTNPFAYADKVMQCDHLGNKYNEDIITNSLTDIAFCPTKQILCIIPSEPLVDSLLSLYNTSNLKKEPKIIHIPMKRYNLSNGCSNRCCISPKGIIVTWQTFQDTIYIISPSHKHVNDYSITAFNSKKEKFLKMLFYPKGSILVTISKIDAKYKLSYWDIKIQQPIYTMDFPHIFYTNNNFSFAPNGLQIAFCLSQELVLYKIPTIIKYTYKTEKQFIYLLCVLENYISQQRPYQNIPKEINHLLKYTLLSVFERS